MSHLEYVPGLQLSDVPLVLVAIVRYSVVLVAIVQYSVVLVAIIQY